jgi:hypothetical protein
MSQFVTQREITSYSYYEEHNQKTDNIEIVGTLGKAKILKELLRIAKMAEGV